ncbi:MAG TPA: baseplate J/gp47 family protein [Dyella sp.]|uniref:baseplate J/gp47 family protein n=1 Tax=Dyella sp. TaxID=1869338 RepID=UPI002C33C3BE|nr:baseplate J/gp47 family protein [Dyella sp.]HUB91410.1 baseplate J/gp47 family protein [Dyella sp.]
MPNITSKSFTQIVSDIATAIQGRASALLDFTVGSVLLSITEAIAAVAIWLQSLILVLLNTTRAALCTGADLDSWMADYGLTRIQATPATGQVTFARFTAAMQATIPVGTQIQTGDGTQQFTVVADTTQPAFNIAANAYIIPAGTSSISATVMAVTAGTAGNVSAGSISVIGQAVPYVDTVTNSAPFVNGENAETDAAFRTRFISYLGSLSRATKIAIGNALLSMQTGVSYTLVENQAYNGTTQLGFFYVVVDDGSGHPSSTFLSSAYNAVDAVRPFTIAFAVFAPVTITANVVMYVTVATGYDPVATKALAQSAVQTYLASLTLGQTCAYTRLAQVAYDASPGVTNITGLTLNGGTADLVATNQQRIVAGSVAAN